MGNTWFNTLPYFTGLYALTPIFEHAAIYTETSLSLGKLYLSQEVLSQRLCVCLLILNARRVTLHVLLSIVVRPRTITKFSPTRLCLSTNALCATSHASVPRTLKKVHKSCVHTSDRLISFLPVLMKWRTCFYKKEHSTLTERTIWKKLIEMLPSIQGFIRSCRVLPCRDI